MKEDKDYRFGYILLLSIIAAMGGFLFGYDEAVISGTVEEVQSQFGLNSLMKGWFVSSALLGATFGALLGGGLSDYFGRKRTMITSAILFAISMVGCAFAGNFTLLVVFRIIGGMGIGVASIVCPMYISEIAVARSRGMLVALYQLAVTIGVLGAYVSNFYLLKYAQTAVATEGWTSYIFVSEWWRGMLGVGVVPSLIFLICVLFLPESPRWLVLKGRTQRAEGILGRIYTNLSEIKHQIRETLDVAANSTSVGYAALWKPGIRRAVIIGVCIAMLGQFMGVNAVLYYGPTIFKDAGIAQDNAFLYQVLIGAANTITTIVAMFIIDRVGRKALIYYGVSGMIIALLAIAAYFQWGTALEISSAWLLAFFIIYIVCCAGSICAIIFVILSEMYPLAVRGVAMSVAGIALWIATFLVGQLTPWMLSTLTPQGTFLIFAFCCIPYVWIMWKQVPDTTGKSLEEIEAYWLKDDLKRTARDIEKQ
ncbi:MAG: sugar porter family MFS transporter [Bacteroidales bacterium]|nr:sugar porter family MFS transporter [Bacteroidales bacterium]MDE6802397.1 sugar porter family MFS transporter [Muribaculaceae bacterium]